MSDSKNMIELQNETHKVDNETFKRAITNMIATNDSAYTTRYQRSGRAYARPYTNEEIQRIIDSGSAVQKSILSNNYFALDGFYRRIIIYYATYLKYVGILIPQYEKKSKAVNEIYNKAIKFIDGIKMYTLCADFASKAFLNGCYYGVVQSSSENGFAVLDLPFKYCSTRYKDQKNNDVIEFDLSYFDSISDKKQRRIALSIYPDEISSAYKKWKNKRSSDYQYYIIPSEIGICFPLFDTSPMFLSTLIDVADYYDYKKFDKERVQEEIRKVLVQKMPHTNDGTLIFEPDEAEAMHAGSVGMMKNNRNVSLLTTYADVDMFTSDASNENVNNILDKAANAIYKQAGVSPQLFSLTGNVAVEASLNKDLGLVMYVANKFANFFTNLINHLFGNSEISFKYQFLPISWYNEKEYIDNSFKLASSGYPFLLPALGMGLSQSDLSNIKNLENDILKLDKKLKPLQSSYTQTQSGGAPTKKDSDKAERTLDREKTAEGGGEE